MQLGSKEMLLMDQGPATAPQLHFGDVLDSGRTLSFIKLPTLLYNLAFLLWVEVTACGEITCLVDVCILFFPSFRKSYSVKLRPLEYSWLIFYPFILDFTHKHFNEGIFVQQFQIGHVDIKIG